MFLLNGSQISTRFDQDYVMYAIDNARSGVKENPATQLIIFLDFWAKILRAAHPVNYSYLPPSSQGKNSMKKYDSKSTIDPVMRNYL